MNLDDDYSDLTDLDSADEYNEKPKKKTAQKNPKDGAYKIKNALKVPRATTYTAQALYGKRAFFFNILTIFKPVTKIRYIAAISIWSQNINEVLF